MRETIGQIGENKACDLLMQHGFNIVHRNVRCLFGEIDIIAYKNQAIHFVEVKTRKSLQYGTPIESYTKKKRERIVKTCFWIIQESNLVLPYYKRFQFDFIGFIMDENDQIIHHDWLENAWD